MSKTLQGRRIAFLVAPEGAEQVELTESWQAVEKAGGQPELVSYQSGQVRAYRHLDAADTFPVDKVVTEVEASDFDGWCYRAVWRTRTHRAPTPTRCVSSVNSSRVGCRWPRSADANRGGRGAWAQAHIVAERADRSAQMPARNGWTRRSWWTADWSPAANRTTCPRSARR